MLYLIVSDSHGDRDILCKLVKNYTGKVDAMFHCGDSELKSDDELFDKMIVVGGIFRTSGKAGRPRSNAACSRTSFGRRLWFESA